MGKLKSPLPTKYKFRYEQILNIMALSGEVPTNLYKYIDITDDTYRRAISDLRKKGYIQTNSGNSLRGYVLTKEGKNYLCESGELSLRPEDIAVKSTDIQKRRRSQYFAALYATFDKLNIRYEPANKPTRAEHSKASNEIIFYAANEYKNELQERGATFKGSRTQGILVGKNTVFPIYVTNKQLIEFNKAEFGLVNQLSKDYFNGGEINNAIIFCPDTGATGEILNSLMHFEEIGKGVNILRTSYFKDVFIIPMDDHLQTSFQTLYNDKRIREVLTKQLNINTKNTYYQCDGYLNDNESVLFMLTLTAAKLKTFLSINKRKNTKGHIICYDFMAPIIKSQISKGNNVTIKTIKAENGMLLANQNTM